MNDHKLFEKLIEKFGIELALSYAEMSMYAFEEALSYSKENDLGSKEYLLNLDADRYFWENIYNTYKTPPSNDTETV